MNNKELIQGIRRDVEALRQAGNSAVDITSLDSYLARLEQSTGEHGGLDPQEGAIPR